MYRDKMQKIQLNNLNQANDMSCIYRFDFLGTDQANAFLEVTINKAENIDYGIFAGASRAEASKLVLATGTFNTIAVGGFDKFYLVAYPDAAWSISTLDINFKLTGSYTGSSTASNKTGLDDLWEDFDKLIAVESTGNAVLDEIFAN